MNRVFILDPGLRRRSGHNYQMAVGIADVLRTRGVACRVVAHREAGQELDSELEMDAVFTQSHYTYLSDDPYSGLFEDYLVGSRKIAHEMKPVARHGIDAQDMFLLPTVGPRQLFGLAMFLQERKVRARVAGLFHRTEPPGTSLAPGSVTAAIHRHALKALSNATDKSRILMAATNDYLARLLEGPLGMNVITLPAPVWYPPPCAGTGVKGQLPAEPVIAFVGHMKDNHGFETIPPLAREIRARWPAVKIRVHLGAVGKRFDLSEYRALHDAGIAEIIEGWLDDDQMAALYCSATVLVMPYDRIAYREMLSAVLSTAIVLGKPSVVPSDCWLADRVAAGEASGTVYSGDGINQIADAIDIVLKDLGTFTRQAAALAEPWRRNECGVAMVEKICTWYANGTATGGHKG